MDQQSSAANQQDQIEDLLRTLHGQIRTTNWVEENTNKLKTENPELIEAWKDEINKLEAPKDNKN
jgi:hypothetical protein